MQLVLKMRCHNLKLGDFFNFLCSHQYLEKTIGSKFMKRTEKLAQPHIQIHKTILPQSQTRTNSLTLNWVHTKKKD